MRYLKRLKNELAELTEKLTVKGPLPEYVSVKKLQRQGAIMVIISLIKMARALDVASDGWSAEHSDDWHEYLVNVKHWLGQAPQLPKAVEKKKEAA